MDKIDMQNVNHPGKFYPGDPGKYHAMRAAFLRVLPKSSPGLTLSEVREAVAPHLPDAQFPGGATAGWWIKALQLDLEARKIVVREPVSPLRFRKV